MMTDRYLPWASPTHIFILAWEILEKRIAEKLRLKEEENIRPKYYTI